jgi:exonuclease III
LGIFRIVLSVIHIVVLALLGATVLNAYIPPKIFPYFNLLSLAFPFLMIINLLLCVFWIISFRKRTVFFILVNLLFLAPAGRWINYNDVKNPSKDFKILTFNNKVNEYGKENVEDYVNSFNADFVFLQEAGYDKLGNPILKNMNESFHSPIISFYSKYKIKEKGDLHLKGNGDAIYADVEIKGKTIRFINVYLEPFQLHKAMVKPTSDVKENEKKAKDLVKRFIPIFKIHQEQVDILKEFVQKSPYPVVLAGDFNSVPNSHEYYTISSVLKDAFVESGKGFSTSFHDYKFPIRIDYIFSSENIKAKSYRVDRSKKLSDHYPVIAEFKIED